MTDCSYLFYISKEKFTKQLFSSSHSHLFLLTKKKLLKQKIVELFGLCHLVMKLMARHKTQARKKEHSSLRKSRYFQATTKMQMFETLHNAFCAELCCSIE